MIRAGCKTRWCMRLPASSCITTRCRPRSRGVAACRSHPRGSHRRCMHDGASELRRIPLPRTPLNKGMKKGRSVSPRPSFAMVLWLLSGGPYLAVHPLEESLTLLVELLVVANHLHLLHRKVV